MDLERKRCSMYTRKNQSWIKHLDFILLDVFCLHVAFVLAYMTRHGMVLPYGNVDYLNLAVDLFPHSCSLHRNSFAGCYQHLS